MVTPNPPFFLRMCTVYFHGVLQGVRRLLQITSVTSLSGVYDWLEQVLAGQILNAAFNSPSTTNAIPLANPGALLLLKRIDLECQTFESRELKSQLATAKPTTGLPIMQ